ncbi:hypothetical protein [Paenibacillus segetis]|uniref:hypothetical protein n=1 Tax=Paenibacillus segetis TaxID=1325360 RepID=UPI0016672127|nr:hypothetical protein [Paenibacillus segetis]
MKRKVVYAGPMTKVFSALFSAISVTVLAIPSLGASVDKTNDAYFSFGFQFITGLIISLAIYIILIMPLSILADGCIAQSMGSKRIMNMITIIFTYCILGVVSGMIFALFVRVFNNISNIVPLFIVGALIYLIYQSLLTWIFNQIRLNYARTRM